MKIKTVFNAVFWLIVIYLFATKGAAINQLIYSLGNFTLKSVALLQGREDVNGVTA